MDVFIKLIGTLARFAENKDNFTEIKSVKYENGAGGLKGFSRLAINPDSIGGSVDITCILKSLDIPEKSVALITINGKRSKTVSSVKDNDKIKLYPFVAGG